MKHIVLSVFGLAVLLIGSYFFLNNYLYQEIPEENIPQRMDLSGTYVCLPLMNGSQDPDCTVGIRTDEGVHYAIDLGLMSQDVPSLMEGDRIQASGIVTSIETLSTDFWQKYPVVGIFSVTDSLQVQQKEAEVPIANATSSLTDQAWIWSETVLQDGTKQTATEDAFVLKFTPELSYESTTDCNSLSGKYVIDGEVLSLASPAMTKMFCEASLEGEYVTQLLLVNSYTISSTTLTLHLNRDYGTMVFEAQ